jgi:hypothetical protein
MMNVLGVDPINVDDNVVTKMKSLYDMSKHQALPLDEYLMESGRKIGGRGMPGFLDKLFVYASMADRENELRRQLMFAAKDRELYENSGNL